MPRTLTETEAALPVTDRRVALRARILSEEHQAADVRAADTGVSLNCQRRRAVYGLHHEPCQAPRDDRFGVACLCPCHDQDVTDAAPVA